MSSEATSAPVSTPDDLAVAVRDVSKVYRVFRKPSDRLRQAIFRKRSYCDEFWALRGVNLEVRRGTTVGIIGANGCGKSTLLQIVAGTVTPSGGGVEVRGRVAALLELGAGFSPEFTGRENVILSGAIQGHSREEMSARMADILHFAEIGSFIDQPVRTYSSGMYVRLAFATAIHTDPEVLIVDEALSVGDVVFQHRCMNRIRALREKGTTILFVSHDHSAVTSLCNEAIWLERGQVRGAGDPARLVKEYLAWAYAQRDAERDGGASVEGAAAVKAPDVADASSPVLRFGNGDARVERYELFDAEGKPTRALKGGDRITIEIEAVLNRPLLRPILGFQLRDYLGNEVTSSNTYYEGRHLPPGSAGQRYRARFTFRWPEFPSAMYNVAVAIADGTQESHVMCDWIDGAIFVRSLPRAPVSGMFRLDGVEVDTESELGGAPSAEERAQ